MSMSAPDASSQRFISKVRVVLVQEGATGILGGNPNGHGERWNKGAAVGRSWSHNDVLGSRSVVVVIGMVGVCLFVGWSRSRWSLSSIGASSIVVIIEVLQDAGSLKEDPLELLEDDLMTNVLSFQSLQGTFSKLAPSGSSHSLASTTAYWTYSLGLTHDQ